MSIAGEYENISSWVADWPHCCDFGADNCDGLQWSAMVLKALESQQNAPFHRILWPGLMIGQVRGSPVGARVTHLRWLWPDMFFACFIYKRSLPSAMSMSAAVRCLCGSKCLAVCRITSLCRRAVKYNTARMSLMGFEWGRLARHLKTL